jgi:hypothetical protein
LCNTAVGATTADNDVDDAATDAAAADAYSKFCTDDDYAI